MSEQAVTRQSATQSRGKEGRVSGLLEALLYASLTHSMYDRMPEYEWTPQRDRVWQQGRGWGGVRLSMVGLASE